VTRDDVSDLRYDAAYCVGYLEVLIESYDGRVDVAKARGALDRLHVIVKTLAAEAVKE